MNQFSLVGRIVEIAERTTKTGWDLMDIFLAVPGNEVKVSGLSKRFSTLNLKNGDLVYVTGTLRPNRKEYKGNTYHEVSLNADKILRFNIGQPTQPANVTPPPVQEELVGANLTNEDVPF